MIYIPGNHEPVRNSEPQPPVSKYQAEELVKQLNIIMLSNPAGIKLHKVGILMYHGNSINAWLKNIPKQGIITERSVIRAMVEMLKNRHLAPIHGEMNTTPTRKDYMVINWIPDIFHTGHVHVKAAGEYNGIILVNSGTMQRTTPYMRKQGIAVSYTHLTLPTTERV